MNTVQATLAHSRRRCACILFWTLTVSETQCYGREQEPRTMTERHPDDVTLDTLHDDLTDLKGEMRSGFADLKTTMIAGFRGLPTRDSSEEMVRLLRNANRLDDERFTQLDARIREQHLETQQVLHAVVDGLGKLVATADRSERRARRRHDRLVEAQRQLLEGQQSLSVDVRALVARIDSLIRGRGNGEPAV